MSELWLPPEPAVPPATKRWREEVYVKDIGQFGFYVVVSCDEPKEGDTPHWIDFAVYEVFAVEEQPVKGRLLFTNSYTQSGNHPTTELPDAEKFFTGFVKWDGCSEWDLGSHHFCSVKEAEDIGRLLRRLYEFAAQWMPSNDFDDELREPLEK
jgi:hypothetical protein